MKSRSLTWIVIAVVLVGRSFFAQTAATSGNVPPLDVKTGLWQITKTTTWTGLPPRYASAMKNGLPVKYNSCVKAKDLSTNPWTNGAEEKCVWTVLNSTGTDLEVKGSSCNFGKEYGMTAEVHGKLHVVDPEDGTGSFQITLTGNGQTMNGNSLYSGKWVAATCPAAVN